MVKMTEISIPYWLGHKLNFIFVRQKRRGGKLTIMVYPCFYWIDDWYYKQWWFINLPF